MNKMGETTNLYTLCPPNTYDLDQSHPFSTPLFRMKVYRMKFTRAVHNCLPMWIFICYRWKLRGIVQLNGIIKQIKSFKLNEVKICPNKTLLAKRFYSSRGNLGHSACHPDFQVLLTSNSHATWSFSSQLEPFLELWGRKENISSG